MNKKIIRGLLLSAIIVTIVWVYLAGKFEQLVKDEIIPILEDNQNLISTDVDKAKIRKYKFSLVLREAVILPNIPVLTTKTDKITISYSFFTQKITIHIGGKVLTTGSGNTELYIPDPSQTIKFDRSLLAKEGWKNSKISFYAPHYKIYHRIDSDGNKEDKLIMESKNDEMELTIYPKDDVQTFSFTSNHKTHSFAAGEDYYENLINKIFPKDIRGNYKDSNGEFSYKFNIDEPPFPSHYHLWELFSKARELAGRTDYTTIASLELDRQEFDELTDKGRNTTGDDLAALFKKKYLFNLVLTQKNSVTSGKQSLFLERTEEKDRIEFSYSDDNNYSKNYKDAVTGLIVDYLSEDKTIINTITADADSSNLTTEDYVPLASLPLKINKLNINGNMEADLDHSNITASLQITVNDYRLKLEGNKTAEEYNSTLYLTKAGSLLKDITNIGQEVYLPLLAKVNPAKENTIKQLIFNIRDNGFPALQAFHKDNNLQEEEELVTGIIFNLEKLNFKINNKSWIAIVTDERVTNFLKNLSDKDYNNAD